jgi:malonyl-CoA O-methyltransferase
LRALEWVRHHECPGGGIRVHSRHSEAYGEVTGYLVPTLLDYGQVELADRLVRWLIDVQSEDGSYADPNQRVPYVFDTAQALRGLLAGVERIPEAAAAATRAADYLRRMAIDDGRGGFRVIHPDAYPVTTHLYALPPLLNAAERFGERGYRTVAERCLQHYLRQPELLRIETLTHDLGYELDGLIELGRRDLAAPVLDELRALQHPDGSLRGTGGARWTCTPGLAQIAIGWYKVGQREPADRALAWLEDHQLRCGGFFGSYGRGASYFHDVVPAWAVKFYLDASRLRTMTSLERPVGVEGP